MSRENDLLLEKLMESKATEDKVAKNVVGKTQVNKAAADAMAAANAAAAAAANGQLAYSGEFQSDGVISSNYQDHGIGTNLFSFRSVNLTWRPYTWFTWSGGSSPFSNTNNLDVFYDGSMTRDVVRIWSNLNAYNSFGFRHITLQERNWSANTPHIASIFVKPILNCEIELKIEEYATDADAAAGTPIARSVNGPSVALLANQEYRIAFPYTSGPDTAPVMVLRVRGKRTAGSGAGITEPFARIYDWMLEEVVAGQTQPSKFVMPHPQRGDLSTNALEEDALKGAIFGLNLSKGSGSLGVNIEAGSAYVPSVEKIVPYPGGTHTLGTSITGVRYLYLEANADGSEGTIVSSTTATATNPYTGTARTMSGDTNRRFIGVVVVYNSIIPQFSDHLGWYTFQDDAAVRQLATHTDATNHNVDCSNVIPLFSRLADIRIRAQHSAATSGTVSAGTPGVHLPANSEGVLKAQYHSSSVRAQDRGPVRTNSSREVVYGQNNANATIFCDIMGFFYER